MTKNLSKKTAFLIFFFFVAMVSFGQGLSKKITVKNQELTVIEICNLLKKKYNLKIAYSNKDEQLQRKIVLKSGTYSIHDFLNATLKANKINYQLTEQQLIIIPVVKRLDKNPVTISGFVEDGETGEKLPGASIYISNTHKGTTTNNYGFFTITLASTVEEIMVSYTGYEIYQDYTKFNTDARLTIKLKSNRDLEEVVVKSAKTVSLQDQTQISKISIPVSVIQDMPHFLGEADVLKTLQMLPGISQGSEATSGLLVRGGTPDQNLMLLDGAPVYNASHMLGIFSAFNTNALKSVDVYKGGFPARFGSRLSSVVDIVTKDGNMKEIHGEGGMSLLATNFTLEGPLKKDKTSFLVSGRRTHVDWIATPIINKLADADDILKAAPYFYDVNVKLHHIISPKDRLFFSWYNGGDVFKFKIRYNDDNSGDFENYNLFAGWGNKIGTVRWNHVFNKKLFANTMVNYTQYKFRSNFSSNSFFDSEKDLIDLKYASNIYDISSRIDFDYRPLPEHSIMFGFASTLHTFTPNIISVKAGNPEDLDIDTTFNDGRQQSPEFSIYGENDWKISPKLKMNVGIHSNVFKAKKKWYSSVQPRIGMRYLLPKNIALKVAYTHMNQFIHLLANNSVTLPTDFWVPSTDKVKPLLSRQLAIGLAKSICNNKIGISIESFYKTMENVIEYKDGASYLNSSTAAWDSKVESGKGTAYGIELLIQKNVGKLKGWIGYTLSHSYRVFPTINYGRRFDYKYDRRHDFELAVTQSLGAHWEVSGSWQFQTGSPFTVPTLKYDGIEDSSPPVSGSLSYDVEYTEGRNNFRLLNYHRLDLSVTWKKKKRRHESIWNLSVYNTYNRQNPFFYFLNTYNEDKTAVLTGVSILPILPSISYAIKF